MEIGRTTTSTTTPTTTTPPPKSPDQETETQTPFQPPKSLSLSNGFLKRHNHNHHHHLHHHLSPPHPIVVIYKECLKNHAASLGGHALDGCGEFMPSPTATHTDPTSLKCAACGCHRNFHRREHDDSNTTTTTTTNTTIEYQSHHRHHPPPPPRHNSASPPPISSYPSAPHMLLALSGGASDGSGLTLAAGSSRKRFRTKFSQIQKGKMYEFAERVGWRFQKKDDDIIQQFCHQIGVDKGVLKVWMHNNKNTINKRSEQNGNATNTVDHHHHQPFDHNHDNAAQVNTNGSSSSC